jgi:hypothetical protein
MFCPQCKAEYRRGFTRCSDCDVDLVEDLASDSSKAPDSAAGHQFSEYNLRPLWRGISQEQCVECCYRLRDEGIPYKVIESPGPPNVRMRVARRYVLCVSPDDYDQAKLALGTQMDEPEVFSETDWRQMEQPEPVGAPQDLLEPVQDGQHEAEADGEKENADGADDEFAGSPNLDESRSRFRDDASRAGFRYCPLCRAEYRPDFLECSDCHVPLVEHAEATTASVRLWKGEDEGEFDRILKGLDGANIPSHHKERAQLSPSVTLLGFPIGSSQSMFQYEVWVFRNDFARAKSILTKLPDPDSESDE